MNKRPKTSLDYIFCLVIGTVFIYALTRTIFSATIIRLPQGTYISMAVVSIIIFLLVFYNKVTRVIFMALAVIFSGYMLYVVRTAPYDYQPALVTHLVALVHMLQGLGPFDPALGRTAVWLVSLGFAMVVVIFMHHKFSFMVLAITGALVFILTWGPGFTRDETAFLLFLFVFVVLLVRKMNGTVAMAFLVAPLCAAVVWFANGQLPTQSDMFTRRTISHVSGAMDAFGDRMYEIFNPTYFSFQSTGFSGPGGRLGGPVTLNNRSVMEVNAPGGTYLAGATSNTYTGFSWVPTLEAGDIYTHGLPPGQFEMLETAAALIRGATLANGGEDISAGRFFRGVSTDNGARPPVEYFTRLGVLSGDGYSLHTYLPMDTVSIRMGRQRSGSLFRPITGWDLHFEDTARDYMPVVQLLPTGDMQTPRMMARDTAYRWQFLNVNPQHDFVAYLMHQAAADTHAQRAGVPMWWHHATLRGEVVGLVPYDEQVFSVWGTHQDPRYVSLSRQDAQVIPQEAVPQESLLQWQSWADDGVYYFVRHIHEAYDWVFTPVPADEDLLEALYTLHSYGIWDEAAVFRWGDLMHRVILSVPEAYRTDGLGLGFVDDALRVGIHSQGALTPHTFYTPLENYWGSHRVHSRGHGGFRFGMYFPSPQLISPEVAPFQNIATFGVDDMMTLLDLLLQAEARGAGYIPRETYLIHWLNMFSADVLAAYAAQVRDHFMAVPDIVPQRVHDLTLSIVDGLEGDFERVMAIRDYLLQFPYTLTPAPVPRGVCFVDHFLFVGQEGYCTYFASAMAVMARIAGVPSRYVEGFVLPPAINHRETVTVTNRMAHAWVEVYLEGFGWHIVEATPTYAFLSNPTLPVPVGGSGAQPFGDDWYRTMAEWIGAPEGGIGDMFYTPIGPISGGAAGAAQGEETPAAEAGRPLSMVWLLILAAVAAVLLVLWRYARVIHAHNKIRKLPPNQQVIAYFEGLLAMVAYYTAPPAAGETPKGYGRHKGKRFAFQSDSVFFKDVIDLYYKAKYSPYAVTPAECALMEEAYFDMVKLIKEKRLPVVYWYLRYVRQVGVVS